MKSTLTSLSLLILACASSSAAEPGDPFSRGEAIELDRAIPANERGILCLTLDDKGRVYGGTTGRAAHLFVYDPAKNEVRSLFRTGGGVGFAHALIRLPDGSLIGGTQVDPTGLAVQTDLTAVGHLYRFVVGEQGPAKVEDLGVPVKGQGIYTLAWIENTNEIVGNTWPDGHFFAYDLKTKQFKDHGAIAGYRTYETPPQAEDINRGTNGDLRYPRQVSRAIAIDPATGAYTGGADGFLYRYDPETHKIEKTTLRLPAAAGREPWASLDAAVVYGRASQEKGDYAALLGGTSDGYLIELRLFAKDKFQLRSRGKPLAQGTIQGLAATEHHGPRVPGDGGHDAHVVYGIGGSFDGMSRSFRFSHGGSTSSIWPGVIPHVNGQPGLNGFGALIADGQGNLYAGERDRIGRLVRFRLKPAEPAKTEPRPVAKSEPPDATVPARLPCHVVFAPAGTTTDGSGYTAIEVGKDGRVYVGSARYGDYGWLLRFDPASKPLFMDKVVNMQQLTGERRSGINTQGKIHAKIVVGADGKVWFASKQAHEIFDTRPEYGEDGDGYPGGHLCYFDPKTGFSRSMGILRKQEGLMGGVIDDARGRLYYRSEPKNHFLVYDIKTGDVRDSGNVGSMGRYMAIDRDGAVYTVGRGTYLCRYHPQTGYVEDLAVKVEGAGTYDAPYYIGVGPNGKLYGLAIGHPSVLEFDIDKVKAAAFPEVTVRNVAPAGPTGFPVQDIHAGVFGKDGKLYYPLNTTGPLDKDGKPQQHLRLMRFDPATKKSETIGAPEVTGFDEDKVKHVYARQAKFRLYYMQGAAVSDDGTLFLMGIYPQLHVACFPQLTAPR
jgi:hypothetical protein